MFPIRKFSWLCGQKRMSHCIWSSYVMVIPWKVASWLATGFTSRSQVTKPTTYCCSEWWCWWPPIMYSILNTQGSTPWSWAFYKHIHLKTNTSTASQHDTDPSTRSFCSIFLTGLGKAKVTQYLVDMWLLHTQQNKFPHATHFLKSTFWWIKRQSISQYSCVPLCIVNKLLANFFSQCYTIWLLHATIFTLPDTWITLSSWYMSMYFAKWLSIWGYSRVVIIIFSFRLSLQVSGWW